jgi:hypothetical protein
MDKEEFIKLEGDTSTKRQSQTYRNPGQDLKNKKLQLKGSNNTTGTQGKNSTSNTSTAIQDDGSKTSG